MKKIILIVTLVFTTTMGVAQIIVNPQTIGGNCMPYRKQWDTTTVTRRVMVINHPSINNLVGTSSGSTPNILDMRNDGVSGFIEYGNNKNNQLNSLSGGTPAPPLVLKINSTCGAHTEIGFGGGAVSTGLYFEVGKPVRDYKVASNINATGQRVGQRVTTKHIATEILGTQYNTQLFVNRNFTHALSVFNNLTNTNGDEKFIVFGDGKTQINAKVKNDKYFVINDVSSTPNESFVVYGSGKTEIRTTASNGTDNVFDIINVVANKSNFRVKANGFVYGREIIVQTNNFPDYVFKNNYQLKPLLEVEKYIAEHEHLQGFEKASVYETNGLPIGEVLKIQQEKIEELTLYLIEMKKEINALKKEKK